ncbi:MAG: hypothetical protein SV760_06300 [Halobacteria archaeon]|nr:hypothetical protein [Halobacteria archaeon]
MSAESSETSYAGSAAKRFGGALIVILTVAYLGASNEILIGFGAAFLFSEAVVLLRTVYEGDMRYFNACLGFVIGLGGVFLAVIAVSRREPQLWLPVVLILSGMVILANSVSQIYHDTGNGPRSL